MSGKLDEGEDLFEEGPVCDFCDIAVEPDESLEPIYIGEQPTPDPHRLEAVEQKNRQTNRMKILGKDSQCFLALYRALQSSPDVELTMSNVVHEMPNPTDFEDAVNADKVGVRLTIEPKEAEVEPDAKVCDDCAKMFRNL